MNRLPHWFRQELPNKNNLAFSLNLLRSLKLHTVCESAHCPNLGKCFLKNSLTFMILGNICTRNCGFCAVERGRTLPLDAQEPDKIGEISALLGLKYMVITSVTRDDLFDGGAHQFFLTVKSIRRFNPRAKIEVLIPDFNPSPDFPGFQRRDECYSVSGGSLENKQRNYRKYSFKDKIGTPDFSLGGSTDSFDALEIVVRAHPEVIGHNIDTVPRLYKRVKDANSSYKRSLNLLKRIKDMDASIYTKSSLMLGLGETKYEVIAAMKDLRKSNCDILTIGQYLAPSRRHLEVERFILPQEFKDYNDIGLNLGFKAVYSGPLVRSSYSAGEVFKRCMMS